MMFAKRFVWLQKRRASATNSPSTSPSSSFLSSLSCCVLKRKHIFFVSFSRDGWKHYDPYPFPRGNEIWRDWSLQWHRRIHGETCRLQNRTVVLRKIEQKNFADWRLCRSGLGMQRCCQIWHPSTSVVGWVWNFFKPLAFGRRFSGLLSPYVGMVMRALSLSCSRSHLCVGLLALAFGVVNHPLAEAQALSIQNSSQMTPSVFRSVLEFVGLIFRVAFLFILFMPVVLTAPFSDCFGSFFRQSWLQLVHHTLELAGAAFIKWGQWAATRPDLFPRDLCAELAKLHTRAPAHSFSYTVRTVEGAFGQKLSDIFEDFEEVPVASGSIAQVHRATLRYGGQHGKKKGPMIVAVKVRHPGVSEIIRRDFIIIKWIANLSILIPGLKWLRLDESVRQFAVFMLTQVDLAREATHLSRFLYNFRSWRDVSFPKPLYPLVHPAVLVETYEQGESISRFVDLSEKSRINRSLAHIGTNTLLKMLLVDNFIHADMHPGNILVRVERGKKPSGKGLFRSKPHLVFLDVGLTAELSKEDRSNLLEFFKAVAVRDGKTAAECTLKFSREQNCPDPDAFIKEVDSSFTFWGSKEADLIHPGECMHDLLEQVRRHRVNVDGDVCTVMVTIMVLEGWQQKLDPDYNIMSSLQTLIFKVDMVESLSYTMTGLMAP